MCGFVYIAPTKWRRGKYTFNPSPAHPSIHPFFFDNLNNPSNTGSNPIILSVVHPPSRFHTLDTMACMLDMLCGI